jgi:F-type H+-transporting ATPase subunit a
MPQIPLDLSITKNAVELFIVSLLLLWIFISTARYYKKNPNKAPKKIALWVEPLILFVRDDIAIPSLGHKYIKFMPYLLTVFFFIFFSNLIGLVPVFPGGANLTGNIAVTMVLALFTFIITTFSANKAYWLHILMLRGCLVVKNTHSTYARYRANWRIYKTICFDGRLFANITAGHIIALGFFSLIFIFGAMNQGLGYGMSVLSVTFAVFMSLLELLVAFIQAYVFTLLSAIFFGMATEEHHHAETH